MLIGQPLAYYNEIDPRAAAVLRGRINAVQAQVFIEESGLI